MRAGEVGRHPKAYVVDPHMVERARFMVRAHERSTGEAPEWAYHLEFVFVPRPVYESVLGYWERRLCGPAILGEPELTWVL